MARNFILYFIILARAIIEEGQTVLNQITSVATPLVWIFVFLTFTFSVLLKPYINRLLESGASVPKKDCTNLLKVALLAWATIVELLIDNLLSQLWQDIIINLLRLEKQFEGRFAIQVCYQCRLRNYFFFTDIWQGFQAMKNFY